MARRTIAGLRGILTGASSGIGRALSIELVRHGARLVLIARRADELKELALEMGDLSGHIEILDGDITDPDVRREAVDLAISRWQGLDMVINNAGVGALGRFAEAPPERLRTIMEVNFFAAAEMIRAALPTLRQGQRPIVVNIGSILGHRAIPRSSEYCASKFALRGLSESLRAELSPLGIDLLLVSPGTTKTEFHEHSLARESVPWANQKGISPEYAAQQIIRAIKAGRHEIIVNWRGCLLLCVNQFFPRLLDRFLARYG